MTTTNPHADSAREQSRQHNGQFGAQHRDEVDVELAPASRCACAHHTDGSTTTFLCPAHATTDPCLTMSHVTGKRRVGSIKNGCCTNCGWTEPAPAVPLTPRDVETLIENKGRFEDGYDEGDINSVLGSFESARMVCAWDTYDDYGYGGGSEFFGQAMIGSKASGPLGVGRAIPNHEETWREVHPDVWRFLSEPDSDIDPESIPSLLSDTAAARQDLDDLSGDGANNVAFESEEEEACRADDCDEDLDDGEGYDGYCGTHADKVAKHEEGGHRPLGQLTDDDDPAEGPDDDCPEC